MKKVIILLPLILSLIGMAQESLPIHKHFKMAKGDSICNIMHSRLVWELGMDSLTATQVDTVFYVYRMDMSSMQIPFSKQDFLSGGFLNSLQMLRYYNEDFQYYLAGIKLLFPCDSSGVILNQSLHRKKYFNSSFGISYDYYLLNLLRYGSMDYIFYVETFHSEGSMFYYAGHDDLFWGVKDNELYVIYLFNCIPIEEYLEWGYDFMAGNTDEYPKQLEDIYNRAKALYPSH